MLRSLLRWYGGKGNLLSKLPPLVPRGGRPYCEPYAGGASLFWAREPAPAEVLNDLNEDLVNFYRVLQDPESFQRLRHVVNCTLYSRAELGRAIRMLREDEKDAVKRAWAFLVSNRFAFGGKQAESEGNWGREISKGSNAKSLNSLQDSFDFFHNRIRRVQIDRVDALQCIRYWDNDDAVFYVDPPYHPDVRVDKKAYKHEADHQHYEQLVQTLLTCKEAVTLSGYRHDVYTPLEAAGWQRIEFQTVCHAAGRVRGSRLQGEGAAKAKVPRTECVWLNPKAQIMVNLGELWYNCPHE